MAAWKKSKLLIWGTTYPEFSTTYYETVCTGAVDGDTGRLVRIYPITLRYRSEPFHQYDWIEAPIQRNPKDPRPESFRIRQDAIKVVDHLDPKGDWAKRSKWILSPTNVQRSVEGLWDAQAESGTSLGLVKPKHVTKVFARKLPKEAKQEWEAQRETALLQKELYVDEEAATKDLVFMPVRYHIKFECDDDRCKGHDMSVLDWGVYVLSRKQYARREGSVPQVERDVISKIEENINLARKDAYLFLGNMQAHPKSFMIVGFYYPPIKKASKKTAPAVPAPQGRLPGIA